MTRSRASLPRLLLGLASLALALGALEVGLRVFRPELGWYNVRDTHLGWSSKEFSRFTPSPKSASETRRRLLVLGDSNLAGSGVEDMDQRFPAVLVERRGAEGLRAKIVASGGWGTDQQLLAYRQKGRAWEPDIVVLAFTATNDLANNASNGNRPDHEKPYFVLDPVTSRLEQYRANGQRVGGLGGGQALPSAPESFLWNLIRFRLGGREERPASGPNGGGPTANGPTAIGPAAGGPGGEGASAGGSRSNDGSAEESPTDGPAVDERYLMYAEFIHPREPYLERMGEIWEGRAELSWSPQLGVNTVSAYIADDAPLVTYQWRLFEELLAILEQEVTATGARLIVMLLPNPLIPGVPETIAGGPFERVLTTPDGPLTLRAAEPRDRLAEITSRLGLEFFDPTGPYIERIVADPDLAGTWWIPQDTHLTPEGHALLAELLDGYLGEFD